MADNKTLSIGIFIMIIVIGSTVISLSNEDKIKVQDYINTKLGKEVVVEKQLEGIESNHVGFVYGQNRKLFMSNKRYNDNVLEK